MLPYAKAPICSQCGSGGASMVVPIRLRMPVVKLLYGERDRVTIRCGKCLYSWKMGEQI